MYAFVTAPDYETSPSATARIIRDTAYVTCPILIAGLYFPWVMLLNTVTYALVGALIEAVRRKAASAE